MSKMKLKIIGRRFYLPQEILEKAKLPDNGQCEVFTVGDEVRIRKESNGKLDMARILRGKPVSARIDRMRKANDAEDV